VIFTVSGLDTKILNGFIGICFRRREEERRYHEEMRMQEEARHREEMMYRSRPDDFMRRPDDMMRNVCIFLKY